MPSLTLVHGAFLLAVMLLVLVPLGLLAAVAGEPPLRRRMLVYWRVSALLMVTVYLLIGPDPLGFATGVLALLLIPLSLWFGDGLYPLPDPADLHADLGGWFQRWRWGVASYCGLGLVLTFPMLLCTKGVLTPACTAWLVPPQTYAALLHPNIAPETLAQAGRIGLYIWTAYALYSTAVLGWEAVQRER